MTLPVGIPTESVFLIVLLRTVAVLWGALLLLAGVRAGRAATGTFFLLVGVVVGLQTTASVSYLLAFAVGLLIFAGGMAAYVYVPRLGTALAMVWPFPLCSLRICTSAGRSTGTCP